MMMITLEQVEKLKEVTGVTYNEAKEVLEQTQGDLLEAVLHLERQGKVKRPQNDGFAKSTTTPKEEPVKAKKQEQSDSFQKFIEWVKRVIHLGNINDFVVYKEDATTLSIPLTIFVLLLMFGFWIIFPLVVVGLFFGYRYRFSGPNFKDERLNRTVDTIADATIKTGEAVKDAVNNLSKEFKRENNQNEEDSAD